MTVFDWDNFLSQAGGWGWDFVPVKKVTFALVQKWDKKLTPGRWLGKSGFLVPVEKDTFRFWVLPRVRVSLTFGFWIFDTLLGMKKTSFVVGRFEPRGILPFFVLLCVCLLCDGRDC